MHAPAEIILKVFCELDSHLSIISLASTSSRCRQVWQDNAALISEEVLSKELPAFNHAVLLLNAQHGPRAKFRRNRHFWLVLERNRLLLSNARTVAASLRHIAVCKATSFRSRLKPKIFVISQGSQRLRLSSR